LHLANEHALARQVIFMLLGLATDAVSDFNVPALRVIRIMRPVMSISRFRGLQVALMSLKAALPTIICVMFLQFTLLFAMSIVNLHAFHDRIWLCSHDEGVRSKRACVNVHFLPETGLLVPRVFTTPLGGDSFNDMGAAVLAAYRCLNRTGFARILEAVLYATPIGDTVVPPHRNHVNALPFILLEVVGNMAVYQTLNAIMVNSIGVTKRRAYLTGPQRCWDATITAVQASRREFVREQQNVGIRQLQVGSGPPARHRVAAAPSALEPASA
jgi:hypothetical protein